MALTNSNVIQYPHQITSSNSTIHLLIFLLHISFKLVFCTIFSKRSYLRANTKTHTHTTILRISFSSMDGKNGFHKWTSVPSKPKSSSPFRSPTLFFTALIKFFIPMYSTSSGEGPLICIYQLHNALTKSLSS